MSALGDQLRSIAAQVDALQAPTPVPTPTPDPPPVVVPPPADGPATNAEIVAAAVAAGYSGAVVSRVTVPSSGLNEYRATPKKDEVLVIVFQAPPPDPIFQLTYVRLPGAGGSRLSILSERCDTYDRNSPAAIAWTDAPDMSLKLATQASIYSRYVLVPGRWYYVLCAAKLPIDPSLPNMQPLSIKVLNSRP